MFYAERKFLESISHLVAKSKDMTKFVNYQEPTFTFKYVLFAIIKALDDDWKNLKCCRVHSRKTIYLKELRKEFSSILSTWYS